MMRKVCDVKDFKKKIFDNKKTVQEKDREEYVYYEEIMIMQ